MGLESKIEADVREGSTVTERLRDGWRVGRYYTEPGLHPHDTVTWEKRMSRILNPDGTPVFEMADVEVPSTWSQLATDIAASKYFRKAGVPGTGHETSIKQLVHRVAHTIREGGEAQGVLHVGEADAFEDELTYMLIHQIGAFNSPVWFNCGLMHDYGIAGKPVGNWYHDLEAGKVVETYDAYSHPQLSACFIQSVKDDLMDIADAVRREMRIFKFGSGTGTNFSRIRAEGEMLSGGGTSSGLMSFLEIFDRAAGATKSGGTTRRAAKMVCLDMDHPDIVRFVNWKVREEEKAKLLIDLGGLPADFNGEAYRTVSGQNSNNSVRIPDAFVQAYLDDGRWQTTWRTSEEGSAPAYKARELMDQIAYAAWRCADPGVQYDTTINRWHTCPNTDIIRASNPCSEYMFLDDSACNLASLNLTKFYNPKTRSFDVTGYRHAAEVFFTAMEVIVGLASYPTEQIAQNSYDYRPLGLGYANLGTLLMLMGLPYDSEEGRAVAGGLTGILCGRAYARSAELAERCGPFAGFAANREPMLDVMRMHRSATGEIPDTEVARPLIAAAAEDWDRAVDLGEQHGYRNAQATVLAPTGTIGLLMDCDTTGVEPEFAQVKYKKLAGGGYFKLVNKSIPLALENLGYSSKQVDQILAYLVGTQTLEGAPHVNRTSLAELGFSDVDMDVIEAALPSAMDLSVIGPELLGDALISRLGLEQRRSGKDLLRELGFDDDQLEQAEATICGRMTVEGAPWLREEHLPVFDCANRCGKTGERFIHHMGHIRMMAAAQPFISGAISKTINMPNEVSVDDIKDAYLESWKLGVKAVALYRDGCKSSQPLSARADDEDEKEEAKPAPKASDSKKAKQHVLPAGPHRRRLPLKRTGFTQECRLGGHKLDFRTREYSDGSLGEIFIDMHKEGAAFRSMINCFAISVSLGLQYGVPLDEYVDCFTFTRFEPQGPTNHPNIRYATSVIDYIFRVLGLEYLGRTDFVHVPPAQVEVAERDPASNPEAEKFDSEMEVDAITDVPAPVAEDGRTKQIKRLMGDAPFCDVCGSLTVRNGSCYRCDNCGQSMGCS